MELQPVESEEVQSPTEVQIYIYPMTSDGDSQGPGYNLNMFSRGEIISDLTDMKKYYIGFIDWNDGTNLDITDEPHQLGWSEDTILKHSYTNPGFYEVTGRIFKVNDIGVPCGWHLFTIRFNIGKNVNTHNEFTQVGGSGFTFLPFDETVPVVGGLSKESIYYKTIKRQLGYIGDSTSPFKLNFAYHSDRLDAEYALAVMDSNFVGKEISRYTGSYAWEGGLTNSTTGSVLHIYNYYDQAPVSMSNQLHSGFYSGSNVNVSGSITSEPILINKGMYKNYGESGDHLGDSDISQVRFMKSTSSMWEMLGFENQEAGNPGSPTYYKNIIPKYYGVSEREGIYYYGESIPESMRVIYENDTCPQKICIDGSSAQNWIGSNEYDNTYYYPVLPKFNVAGKFDDVTLGLQGNKNPYGSKILWDEDDVVSPVSNLSFSNRYLEIDLDLSSLSGGSLDDLSGNAFKGLIIGDYRMTFEDDTRKPMRDDVINEPSIGSKDKAI